GAHHRVVALHGDGDVVVLAEGEGGAVVLGAARPAAGAAADGIERGAAAAADDVAEPADLAPLVDVVVAGEQEQDTVPGEQRGVALARDRIAAVVAARVGAIVGGREDGAGA